ncbi:hypothetical protein M0802_006709 [Mischocyttarus mexicanus]|nr:hypothetical protein M0802_006709 [Mischocyttarus mexicanus]
MTTRLNIVEVIVVMVERGHHLAGWLKYHKASPQMSTLIFDLALLARPNGRITNSDVSSMLITLIVIEVGANKSSHFLTDQKPDFEGPEEPFESKRTQRAESNRWIGRWRSEKKRGMCKSQLFYDSPERGAPHLFAIVSLQNGRRRRRRRRVYLLKLTMIKIALGTNGGNDDDDDDDDNDDDDDDS